MAKPLLAVLLLLAWALPVAADDDAQTAEVRHRLTVADPAARLLLVTHQVNITALTGESTRSGQDLVLRIAPDGTVTTLGSIAIPVP